MKDIEKELEINKQLLNEKEELLKKIKQEQEKGKLLDAQISILREEQDEKGIQR